MYRYLNYCMNVSFGIFKNEMCCEMIILITIIIFKIKKINNAFLLYKLNEYDNFIITI